MLMGAYGGFGKQYWFIEIEKRKPRGLPRRVSPNCRFKEVESKT